MSETYIYDNTEVVKTGRVAAKQAAIKSRRSERTPMAGDVLYEVKPADPENGTWTKWVRQRDLYEIIKQEQEDNKNARAIPRQAIPEIDDENTA